MYTNCHRPQEATYMSCLVPGKQLNLRESQELTALACAVYLKDQQRSRTFINQRRSANRIPHLFLHLYQEIRIFSLKKLF